jgi:hypothetical protein
MADKAARVAVARGVRAKAVKEAKVAKVAKVARVARVARAARADKAAVTGLRSAPARVAWSEWASAARRQAISRIRALLALVVVDPPTAIWFKPAHALQTNVSTRPLVAK